MRNLLAAAAILLAVPAIAQPPGAGGGAPDSGIATNASDQPTASQETFAPADTPTRRPTHLPTSTALPPNTETATVPPPSTPTATEPPQSIATLRAALSSIAEPAVGSAGLAPLMRAVDAGGGAPVLALGAVLALFAVWVGARLSSARARAEHRRARRTLATAMLLELRRIDAVLRRVVALETAGSFPPLEHPIMEAALRDLTLFQTATAARIAQFHSALRSIQHEIGDYRDNPLRWAGRLTELNQLIKGRSATACRAVPELVKALEDEGGKPPPPLPESPSPSTANPSGLPPPPFGAHEGDDWTL
jgi:hypothetical protein